MGPLGGNMAETLRSDTLYMKRQRLAAPTAPRLQFCGDSSAVRSASLPCSEAMTQRAVCLNWARTDLWEGRGPIPAPTRPAI
jgi:hypothetical protein